eukprot:scaffold53736_cov39-Cyclotella_meneghiniana.AAC.3
MSVTPPVSVLPQLLPILLRRHQHRQTRISPIRPSRLAVIHQIKSPPQLPGIPQTAMIMEKGSRLFPVEW